MVHIYNYKMMKRLFCAGILLLLCFGAWAQDGRKLSYDIRQLVSQASQFRRASGASQPATLRAMIRFQSGEAEAVMDAYGCKVITQIGDIYVADIPMYELRALAADQRVVRIENHQGGKVLMDVAPQWINTPEIAKDTRLPQAFTGQGVMLGIIDCGIEVAHPNFYTADGSRLRVTRFLDQFATDDEPFGQTIDLGREYTTEADIKGKACAGDSHRQYHGTHCLGIAAGTGYTTPYRGVAWEAELTAVDSKVAGDENYGSANELALMKYIFDVADARHMPCVITYSIGFNALPGDCELFEEAIARMTGPGHILVAAAGNESNQMTYVRKTKDQTAVVNLCSDDALTTAFLFTSGDFTLTCYTYYTVDDPSDPEGEKEIILADSVVYVSSEGSVSRNLVGNPLTVEKSDTLYTISYVLSHDDVYLDYVRLVVEGDCEAQMIPESESTFKNIDNLEADYVGATNDHNVGLPGCLPSVVTVGALNTRAQYINLKGDTITKWGSRSPEGTIAVFSSQGPTLDGRLKPDVVAPGVNIHASANSYYKSDYGTNVVASTPFEGRDYPWIAISGTSMATPVMAGIVALWLQANPDLSPDDVKRIIRETCHPLGDTVPNNTYGYGLVDAYAGLLNILGLPAAIDRLSQHQPSALAIRPVNGGIRLLFDHAPTQPFTVRLYDLSGQLLAEHALRPAATDYFLPLTASGITVVQVNSSEPGITGSELIKQ